MSRVTKRGANCTRTHTMSYYCYQPIISRKRYKSEAQDGKKTATNHIFEK